MSGNFRKMCKVWIQQMYYKDKNLLHCAIFVLLWAGNTFGKHFKRAAHVNVWEKSGAKLL